MDKDREMDMSVVSHIILFLLGILVGHILTYWVIIQN